MYADKELMRLFRHYEKLRDAKWNLGYVELEVPIRNGFKKSFIIKEEYKDVKELPNILLKINNFVICKNKQFLRKNYETKKMAPLTHKLQTLEEKVIAENNWYKYFNRIYITRSNYDRGHWEYEFKHSFMFATKIEKNYITRVQVIDSELESQVKRLQNHFETNDLFNKVYKEKGISWHNKDSYAGYKIHHKKIRGYQIDIE